MRDRLFRGKRIDNGEWVYGFLYESAKSSTYNAESFILEKEELSINYKLDKGVITYVEFIQVDPSTVGQYTGLKDKNGKKIFEGDIVKNLINDGIFVVKYKNSLACFLGISIHGNPSTGLCSGFEVFGNIHDTPELLEVRE